MLTNFLVNDRLPDEILARQRKIPVKPAAVMLFGRYVRLEPLRLDRDVETLFLFSNGEAAQLGEHSVGAYDPDQLIWRYMGGGPFAAVGELATYLSHQVHAENGLCFTVFDIPTGKPVGVVNYMNNLPMHLKVELGNIWYSPLVQGTKANLESTYLLLQHAFALGYRRIEWKCDALNERSKRSAMRMGFTFEGIQEYQVIMKERSRDTAWFRLLDREWSVAKKNLENLLYGTNVLRIEAPTIRQMKREEIDRVAKTFSFPWLPFDESVKKWTRYLAEQDQDIRAVYLMENYGELVGYASLLLESAYAPFKQAKIPEIHDLWISESQRKRGFGKALIQYLENQARIHGYRQIGIGVGLYRDYGTAQALYSKLGFVPDMNGISYKCSPVVPGQAYPVDDDLILWSTKSL